MIFTCELCQSQFLTESDPHVIIPGPETKIYCYCQIKGNEQKWIDQLKHEHKLYQKHLDGLKAENERLEAENAKLLGVVKFYAENKNWRDIVAEEAYGNNCGLERGCFDSIIYEDCQDDIGGKRARQALKELEEK